MLLRASVRGTANELDERGVYQTYYLVWVERAGRSWSLRRSIAAFRSLHAALLRLNPPGGVPPLPAAARRAALLMSAEPVVLMEQLDRFLHLLLAQHPLACAPPLLEFVEARRAEAPDGEARPYAAQDAPPLPPLAGAVARQPPSPREEVLCTLTPASARVRWRVSRLPAEMACTQLVLGAPPGLGLEAAAHVPSRLLLVQRGGSLMQHTIPAWTDEEIEAEREAEIEAEREAEREAELEEEGQAGVRGERDGGVQAELQAGGEREPFHMLLSHLKLRWSSMMGSSENDEESRREAVVEEAPLAESAAMAEGAPSTPARTREERSWDAALQPVPAFTLLKALYGKRVASLAAGKAHVLAVCEGAVAEVLSWGQGGDGQLGHGDLSHEPHPRPLEKFQGKGASGIACGQAHSVVIASGGAYTFGCAANGQLGQGDLRSQPYPRRVAAAANGKGAEYVRAAAGDRHTVLIDAMGGACAFGCGRSGQLGTGFAQDEVRPRVMSSLGGQRLRAASCGAAHTLLVSREGRLFATGANGQGQLGLGDYAPRHWPTLIASLSHLAIATITSAADFSLVVTTDGAIFTFGAFAAAERHAPLPTPLPLPAGVRPAALCCSAAAVALLLRRDEAVAVGEEECDRATPQEAARPTIAGDEALAEEAARLCLDEAGRLGGGGVLRQGLLRLEVGWLRGARLTCVQLQREALLLLEPSVEAAGEGLGHEVHRRVPLERIDAVSAAGPRVRALLSDGSELVLLAETAGDAQAWKLALQEARGSSPRRAFLQAALGEALASRRSATAAEQLRWLCLAASWGETAEVGALLRAGAAPGGVSRGHGRTPLHYAALNGHAKAASVLLAHRADPNQADGEGLSPLEAALEFEHAECAHVLARAGAHITNHAQELAMRGPRAARLLASLRAAQYEASRRAAGLVRTTSLPNKKSARREVAKQHRSTRQWRETLVRNETYLSHLGLPVAAAAPPLADEARRTTPPAAPLLPRVDVEHIAAGKGELPAGLNFNASELRRLCKQGVPPELRCLVWPLLLRMRAPLDPPAEEYASLRTTAIERMASEGEEEVRLAALITQDLERTFPTLGLFAAGTAMREQLRELLWVFCALPNGLRYQQGMTHLGAALLLHLQEARLACAALNALLVGYPVLRACVSMHVAPALEFFDGALAAQQPALASHLRSLDITSDMYVMPWLLTMFSRSLPLSTACRIWDCILSEGERALFCAALAVMQLLQPVLLVAGFEECLQLLQNLPQEGTLLRESDLLAAMARVQLPNAQYDQLLLTCIVHAGLTQGLRS